MNCGILIHTFTTFIGSKQDEAHLKVYYVLIQSHYSKHKSDRIT